MWCGVLQSLVNPQDHMGSFVEMFPLDLLNQDFYEWSLGQAFLEGSPSNSVAASL